MPVLEPAVVTVVDSTDDGQWYKVWLEPVGSGWVSADDFVDSEDCRPDRDTRCPAFSAVNEAEFVIGLDITCCVSIGSDDAPEYELLVFQGETRVAEDSRIEFRSLDGQWIAEADFAARANCVEILSARSLHRSSTPRAAASASAAASSKRSS